MKEYAVNNWNKIGNMFHQHLLFNSIIEPCLKANIGTLQVDDSTSPKVAVYSIPMMTFLTGDSDTQTAVDLVESLPALTIFIVPDEEWKQLIKKTWGDRLVTNTRTHFDHTSLDITHLRKLKENLPEGYVLKKLDYDSAAQINKDYTIQIQMYFGSKRNFVDNGFGFCILHYERLVSYAYTPFPFDDEFEIQVFTVETSQYRRKGLATIVSAALIEYGLENNMVPHWDAANEPSEKLALKLGYSNPISWEAFYYKPRET